MLAQRHGFIIDISLSAEPQLAVNNTARRRRNFTYKFTLSSKSHNFVRRGPGSCALDLPR